MITIEQLKEINMDTGTLVIILTSSLLGYFMVKHFEMKKELSRNELDREHDMIYRSIDSLREEMCDDVEKLTNKIESVENGIYSQMTNRFRSFSNALVDADRRIDEITSKEEDKEPTLFDNVK